jgi:hypothetical protein
MISKRQISISKRIRQRRTTWEAKIWPVLSWIIVVVGFSACVILMASSGAGRAMTSGHKLRGNATKRVAIATNGVAAVRSYLRDNTPSGRFQIISLGDWEQTAKRGDKRALIRYRYVNESGGWSIRERLFYLRRGRIVWDCDPWNANRW